MQKFDNIIRIRIITKFLPLVTNRPRRATLSEGLYSLFILFIPWPLQTIFPSPAIDSTPVPESGRCSDPLPHRHSHKLPAERPEHDLPGTCGFRQTQSSGDEACLRPQTERSPGHTFSFVPSRITPQKSRQDAPCGHPWG